MRMSFFSVRVALLLIVANAAMASPASAQDNLDVKQELAAMRAELQQLRAEVAALKAAREAAPPSPAAATAQDSATVELLKAQVAELAQTKVESTSKFPVKVFGTVHADVFANSATPNWLDIPNLVNPPPADGHAGTFSATLRQTRLGFTADGPTLGGVRTSAVVAMDFFGGIPGFQTGQVMGLPRLLVAFARLDGEKTAAEIGQDHMILSPKDPTSLAAFAFPLLFRSGNLYLRTPQVRVERAITSRVRASGGIVAPIGGDITVEDYRFVPPALCWRAFATSRSAGERSATRAASRPPRVWSISASQDTMGGSVAPWNLPTAGRALSISRCAATGSASRARPSRARTSTRSAGRSASMRGQQAAGRSFRSNRRRGSRFRRARESTKSAAPRASSCRDGAIRPSTAT